MKNSLFTSLNAVLLILIAALILRFCYWKNNSVNGYNATSWDAFGYYMYQPAIFIYQDIKNLEWVPQIDSTYHVSGGKFYQAQKASNGNYVFKYLGGICILQVPFFFIGHTLAKFNNVAQDGFSWPYQYSIMLGAIFWFFIGMLFLRSVLLKYFSDAITATTLLLLFFTSNLPQYISIDGAMSHSWIFSMYCMLLWFTYKWHEKPSIGFAFAIGLIGGIATISRPTELILLFIPLLWGCESKIQARQKWEMVQQNYAHVVIALTGALVGVLPQLIYWKYVSGSFVYDVGSKWYFLNPWFRVLFGFHSGWLIYTPITLLFIIGFWFMNMYPFKKSVLVFCILNFWIITAWSDWKYGVSYAGRALSQGSAVYSLTLASFISSYYSPKRKYWMLLIAVVLTCINFYQLKIYNSGIYSNFSVIEKIVSYPFKN
ncbi:MAG TPA: hypothetical protein PLN13_12820 [Bacteroidia bacterium]|nr:hypothetical protein [Bacteroidia bacterium]HRH09458.1 hypothetical protein [Bacteroidia bacterium]